MKINHFLCDICGEKFNNGEGFTVKVRYPISEKNKGMTTGHHYRKEKTMDLCVICGVERLLIHDLGA